MYRHVQLHTDALGVQKGCHKREMELQVVLSSRVWVLGLNSGPLKKQYSLNHRAISLQPT